MDSTIAKGFELMIYGLGGVFLSLIILYAMIKVSVAIAKKEARKASAGKN